MKYRKPVQTMLTVFGISLSALAFIHTAFAAEEGKEEQDAPTVRICMSDTTPDGSAWKKDGGREEYYQNEVSFTIEVCGKDLETVSARYELETGKSGYVEFGIGEKEGPEDPADAREGADQTVRTGTFVLDDTGNDPALRGDVLTGLEIFVRNADGNTPGPEKIINETNLTFGVEDGRIFKREDSADIVIDKNAPKLSVNLPDPAASTNSRGSVYYFSSGQSVTVWLREANLFTEGTELSFTTTEKGVRTVHRIRPDDSSFFTRDGALYGFSMPVRDGTALGDFKIKSAADLAANRSSFTGSAKNTYIVDCTAPELFIDVSGAGMTEIFSNGRYLFVKYDRPAAGSSGAYASGEAAELTVTARVRDENQTADTGAGYRERYYISAGANGKKWRAEPAENAQELCFAKTVRIPPDSAGMLSLEWNIMDLAGNVPEDFTCGELLAPMKKMLPIRDGRIAGSFVCDRMRPSGNDAGTAAPEIILETASRPECRVGDNVPLFKESVLYNLNIHDPAFEGQDEEPVCSGLREVSWAVASSKRGISTSGNENYYYGETAASLSIPVIAEEHTEADDIALFVRVTDMSGNETVYTQLLAIDNEAPRVTVSYDNQSSENEAFYRDSRVLTVMVDERNFDPERTLVFTNADSSNWHTAGTVRTAVIDYSSDGHYTFEMSAADLAGNAAVIDYTNGGANADPQSFTIDRTPPEITLSFDHENARNGRYFNTPRLASLTIAESNFRETGLELTLRASLDGEEIPSPLHRGWNTDGERWTSELLFAADGDYALEISYTDPAGNRAEPVKTEMFTIDTTPPVIAVSGAEDRRAYREGAAPVIEYSDRNFDPALAGLMWSFTDLKGTRLLDGLEAGTVTGSEKGRVITLPDPERLPENDGIYRLCASAMDLAGNLTETKEIRYSLNRFGSVYDAEGFPETGKLVGKSVKEAPAIRIRETNPDALRTFSVRLSANDSVRELKEGQDFTVEAREEESAWKQYIYTIRENVFRDASGKLEQGEYEVTVESEDRAGNLNSNRTGADAGRLGITFTLDDTGPSGYINAAGLLQGEKNIKASEADVTVGWEDNTGMEKVELYLNGSLYDSLSGEELRRAAGTYVLKVKESDRMQSVYAVLTDPAGNQTRLDALEFYLNTSPLGQLFHHPVLFPAFCTAGGFAAVIVWILLFRRKRKG